MWCSHLYETPPYEPEGLIGLFNAGLLHYLGTLHTYTVRDKQTGSRPGTGVTVCLDACVDTGALAGRALLDRRTFRRLAYLITLTGGLATIGGFLCGFKVTVRE